jgi:hypothetical protein
MSGTIITVLDGGHWTPTAEVSELFSFFNFKTGQGRQAAQASAVHVLNKEIQKLKKVSDPTEIASRIRFEVTNVLQFFTVLILQCSNTATLPSSNFQETKLQKFKLLKFKFQLGNWELGNPPSSFSRSRQNWIQANAGNSNPIGFFIFFISFFIMPSVD